MHPAMKSTLLLFVVAAPLAAQQPLRPTDVIRLLASGTAPAAVADRIGRDCLTFRPSPRDRRNFQALGADANVLARIDACGRRGVRRPSPLATAPAVAPAPIPKAPAASAALPPAATPMPTPAPAAQAAPDQTGFVQGTGQRGVVGLPAANPLVFEVRDAGGKAVSGAQVTFTSDNAVIHPESPTTDVAGHIRVGVTFGHASGKSVVRAAVGQIFRSATLYPSAASPSRLELHLGAEAVGDTLHLAPDTTVTVRVVATDEYGNAVALVGLQPLSGDEAIVRVERVGGDTVAGALTLHSRGQGSTQLALQASGIFSNLTVVVAH